MTHSTSPKAQKHTYKAFKTKMSVMTRVGL